MHHTILLVRANHYDQNQTDGKHRTAASPLKKKNRGSGIAVNHLVLLFNVFFLYLLLNGFAGADWCRTLLQKVKLGSQVEQFCEWCFFPLASHSSSTSNCNLEEELFVFVCYYCYCERASFFFLRARVVQPKTRTQQPVYTHIHSCIYTRILCITK